MRKEKKDTSPKLSNAGREICIRKRKDGREQPCWLFAVRGVRSECLWIAICTYVQTRRLLVQGALPWISLSTYAHELSLSIFFISPHLSPPRSIFRLLIFTLVIPEPALVMLHLHLAQSGCTVSHFNAHSAELTDKNTKTVVCFHNRIRTTPLAMRKVERAGKPHCDATCSVVKPIRQR